VLLLFLFLGRYKIFEVVKLVIAMNLKIQSYKFYT